MIQPGELLPRPDALTPEGHHLDYARVWQHRNLVLFVLPRDRRELAREYLSDVAARLAALRPDDTTLAVSDPVGDRLPSDTLVVTDRWGEVVHAQPLPPDVTRWPRAGEIVAWVDFVRVQCPECPP